MERERQGQAGWFPELRLQSTDQFVPLAYEMNGTWGADADKFFRFVVECAGTEGTRAAELYHWSAMTLGGALAAVGGRRVRAWARVVLAQSSGSWLRWQFCPVG